VLSARIFASRGWPEKDNIAGTEVRFVVKQHRTLMHCVQSARGHAFKRRRL
jgi:hypothetical protein